MSLLLLFRTATAAGNDAEGVHGTTVDTTNSGYGASNAWTSVTIGTAATCVYDNTAVAHGSSALRIATAGTASQVFTTWLGPLPSHGRDYGRFYFRMASGGVARTLMRSRSGGTQIARVALTAADKLELRNGANSSVAIGTTTLAANTWYRVEWDVQPGTGTDATLYLYAGDSTTPLETITSNSTYGAVSTVDEHSFGQVVSTASLASLWLDGMQANSTGLPGPATGVAYVETQSSANAAGATITTSSTVPAGATGFATLSAVPTSATLAAATGWTVANAAQAQSTSFQVESYTAASVAASTAYAFNKDTGTRYVVTATVVAGAQTTLGATSQAVRSSAVASHTTPAVTAHAGALLVATFTARVFSSDVPSMNTWTLDTASVAAGWVKQNDTVGADGSTNTRHMVATLAVAADASVTCTATLATAEPAIVNIAEHRVLAATAQQGAATLTASPTMTPAATAATGGAATLTAGPAFTAAATAETAAAVALTAAPTLGAAGTATAVGAVALAATPTLTAAAAVTAVAAAALTASPALTAAGTGTATAAAALTASPTLTAAATRTQAAAVTLSAGPTLTAAATATTAGAAALSAAPTLTAAATSANDAGTALTSSAAVTVGGAMAATAAAALTATPALTAGAVTATAATAVLLAVPTLTVAGLADARATAAPTATPLLTAAAASTSAAATAALTAAPALTATATTTRPVTPATYTRSHVARAYTHPTGRSS